MDFKKIKNDSRLKNFVINECKENQSSIIFSNDIPKDDILIIKVDKFYNNLHLSETPKSPDCLIVIACKSRGYGLFLVELKSKTFKADEIIKKFENCFNDFIKQRFREYFYISYEKIELSLVSFFDKNRDEYDSSLIMETFMDIKFNYLNKNYMIKPFLRHQTIKLCYSKN